jgi:uncharacterized protein (TIGR03067 family)
MRQFVMLAAGVLAGTPVVLAADPTPEEVVQTEFQNLQGTWLYESLEEDGKKTDAETLKARTFLVGADAFLVRQGNKIVQAGELTLDPAKTPRTFNAAVRGGEPKGAAFLGIYQLDKDTLKLCYDPAGQARPAEFKAEAKSGLVTAVLKRKTPAPAIEIVGKYRSETIESSGRKLTTEVTIEKRGDAYLLSYRNSTGGLIYVATGIRTGDTLSTCWVSAGQAGVSVYKIEKGPKLIGEYTPLAGVGLLTAETLVPFRRID